MLFTDLSDDDPDLVATFHPFNLKLAAGRQRSFASPTRRRRPAVRLEPTLPVARTDRLPHGSPSVASFAVRQVGALAAYTLGSRKGSTSVTLFRTSRSLFI